MDMAFHSSIMEWSVIVIIFAFHRTVRNYDCCVECKDNDDNTPLHYAAMEGHVHVVQALLSDLAADVEARI